MVTSILTSELIGYIVASILTILILSYTIGQNPLYKFIIHIFIGASAGYAGAIVLRDFLIPQIANMSFPQSIIPIILLVLISLKAFPQTARYGNISSALLLGVGTSMAIYGAILGTLIPFISSSSMIFSPSDVQQALQGNQIEKVILLVLQGTIILLGIITTLTYFQFTARKTTSGTPVRPKIINSLAKLGQGFIAITFGVIFAGIYSAALTAFVERIDFFLDLAKILQQTVK